jgi:uncharacterized protein YndB with AHSA1/START domain
MAEIVQEVVINAPREKVFEAISTADGVKCWWTDDTAIDPRLGGKAELRFNDKQTIFNMETTIFDPPEELTWKCMNGPAEWIGTSVTWLLTPAGEGGTNLRLEHINWRKTDGEYPAVVETWGKLLPVLKEYAEGGSPGPHFKSG